MSAHYCDERAYSFLRCSLARISTPEGLFDCAIGVAMHAMDDCCPRQLRSELVRIESQVRRRTHSGNSLALLSHLHAELFENHQWNGDDLINRHPTAAMIPFVLQYRRGLPVILCLLYHVTAARLGLETEGLELPGSFLIRVRDVERRPGGAGSVVIDPSRAGRLVSDHELAALCRAQWTATRATAVGNSYPRVVTHRQWLWRLMDDLQELLLRGDHRLDWEAVQEMRGLLRDNDPDLELASA